MSYSALVTVSGLAIPPGSTLDLGNSARLFVNPVGEGQDPDPFPDPNVTLYKAPRLADGRFREAARILLGFSLGEGAVADGEVIKRVAEMYMLPLRLLTKGSIIMGLGTVSQSELSEMMAAGCVSVAPTARSQIIADLTVGDCRDVQQSLAGFGVTEVFRAPIAGFIQGYYIQDPGEQSLAFLLALETLVTPSVKNRGRSGRSNDVSNYAAWLAATNDQEQRQYRNTMTKAYGCRQAVRHGEANLSKVADAKSFLRRNRGKLMDISRMALQRTLFMVASGKLSSPDQIVPVLSALKNGASAYARSFPMLTFGTCRERCQLDLSEFTITTHGDGSVSFNVP